MGGGCCAGRRWGLVSRRMLGRRCWLIDLGRLLVRLRLSRQVSRLETRGKVRRMETGW
jgi:hypothetical protein